MSKVIFDKKLSQAIDGWRAKFPANQSRSALLMALRLCQEAYGHLTHEIMDAVARYLDLPKIYVTEVATFYSMYRHAPAGKYTIAVCGSLSCQLCGAASLIDHLKKRLKIDLNQTSDDGLFTLKEAECLAACCGAPMLIVNDQHFHENLTIDKVDQLIDQLTAEGNK
jgi:NADH-quinone oxidoreductase subunit E